MGLAVELRKGEADSLVLVLHCPVRSNIWLLSYARRGVESINKDRAPHFYESGLEGGRIHSEEILSMMIIACTRGCDTRIDSRSYT